MEHNLTFLKPGDTGIVERLTNPDPIRRRLIDIGFSTGTTVYCLGKSPLGDPTAYGIKGTVIALRQEDAAQITLRKEIPSWD